jgi:hydroxymethylpyrimidine pyrophosphatase-like HAD family hydrolase
MYPQIQLLSIDFDGTLVSRGSETIFDPHCMKLIHELQRAGAI